MTEKEYQVIENTPVNVVYTVHELKVISAAIHNNLIMLDGRSSWAKQLKRVKNKIDKTWKSATK